MINVVPKKLVFIGGSYKGAAGRVHITSSRLDGYWEITAGVFSKNIEDSVRTVRESYLKECNIYNSIEEMAESQDFDAVSIVTPTPLHYAHIEKIISRTKATIFCEKTVAASVEEAKNIKAKLQKNKSKLYVFYNYTAYPMVREIQSMISNGKLGTILSVEATMPQQTFLLKDRDGTAIKPQSWRIDTDNKIPVVSLDLGAHLINLVEFICNKRFKYASGFEASLGNFNQTIDYVSGNLVLGENIPVSIKYGKCFIGNDNGLQISVYGSDKSVNWNQKCPDIMTIADSYGKINQMTLMDNELNIANQRRYQRFKSGHPTGFIEAFANYYVDLALENDLYIFDIDDSLHGLEVLEALHYSARNKSLLIDIDKFKIREI